MTIHGDPIERATRPHRAALAVTLIFAFAAPASLTAPPGLAAQGLEPEQVAELQEVEAAVLSPDGSRVAYTLSVPRRADEAPGRSHRELWVVPVSGGEPTALIRAPGRATGPAWSPDGRRIAFLARLSGHDQTQVYAVAVGAGEPERLTGSPTGVSSFAWSPDGRAIAYTAREPEPAEAVERRARGDDVEVAGENVRHARLWIVDLGTDARRALTPADRTVRDFVWSPTGGRLAVQLTEEAGADAGLLFRRLYTVPAAGGQAKPLAQTEGKLGAMAWSPDGEHLAYLGATSLNDPLAQSVFVVPAAGGAPENLTVGYEGSATSAAWEDGRTVLFVADAGTRTRLNRVRVGRGAIQRVAGGGAEVFGGVSLDERRRTFVTAASTARHPSEVYVGRMREGQLIRVTHHNGWLEEVRLARQETISWTGADGWTIEGVLVHPLNGEPGVRYPLAILPHGGPEGISLDGWTTRPLYPAQVLAARGYAVLMPNYRGSGGRGVEFSKGDHRDLGGEEFEDVLAGIDHLADEGLIDPDRVGISGTSYGGYFSQWAATRHSDRFAAAVTFAGLSNWMSFTGTTDIPYEMSIVHWDLWPYEHPGLAWDRSPVAHVSGETTPMLVVHGLADERVHPEQSLEIHTALEIMGVPTGLVLYPREPHGLLERAHQLDFMHRLLEWLDRYVKGDAVPATR